MSTASPASWSRRALDHDATVVHDHHLVGGAFGLGELVGGDEQRATAVALGADQFADHLATFGVDRRGGFVEHQDARASQ